MHKHTNTAMFFLLILKKNCLFLFFSLRCHLRLLFELKRNRSTELSRTCRTTHKNEQGPSEVSYSTEPPPSRKFPTNTLEYKEIGCHPCSSLSFCFRFTFQPSVQRSISICRWTCPHDKAPASIQCYKKVERCIHQLFSSRTVLNLPVVILRFLFSVLFGNRNKSNWKLRLKNNFLNFDYNYRPVILARFVLCSAFGFHFGKFCVCSWREILG